MTRSALLLAMVSLGPPSLRAQGQAHEIFREVSIAPFGRIALDQPFRPSQSFAYRVRPGLYQLPPGFGDTKGILVRVDSSDIVQALVFVYVEGKDFDAAKADYITDLGIPLGTEETDSAGVRTLRARWQDSRTYFEVFQRIHPDSVPEVMAVLRDR